MRVTGWDERAPPCQPFVLPLCPLPAHVQVKDQPPLDESPEDSMTTGDWDELADMDPAPTGDDTPAVVVVEPSAVIEGAGDTGNGI